MNASIYYAGRRCNAMPNEWADLPGVIASPRMKVVLSACALIIEARLTGRSCSEELPPHAHF